MDINKSTLEYMKSLTLLCVEDSKTIQHLYSLIFNNYFKTIIFADNGQDGYKKFIDENIDIVISDYYMPILDGVQMIEKIRQVNSTIPIILVSAIESKAIIIKALQLHVNDFIQKPIKKEDVITRVTNTSKLLIANRCLQVQQKRKEKNREELQKKQTYQEYQENIAFSKELNILRNDFYYQMIDTKCDMLIDFFYKPLDLLSGDAYSARRLGNNITFYLLVDGMGKGLSASLTSMLMTSFINHLIDKIVDMDEFNLNTIVKESIDYIKPILLEDEALAIDYIVIDCNTNLLYYAKFASPVFLLQDINNKIIKLKSNNPPLSKYQKSFNISEYDISNIVKFLFYSDGLVENTALEVDKTYNEFIEEDFKTSFTKKEFSNKFIQKISTQEDDISFIFIHKLYLDNSEFFTKIYKATLENIDVANEWYKNLWESFSNDKEIRDTASLTFAELYMNAYEHGCLKISTKEKNKLIEDDIYFETLTEKESLYNKNIQVNVNKVKYESSTYILTQIIDEGDGFDTNILTDIFRFRHAYNGRGVFISRNNSLGIYYNEIGNSITIINKV